ncbi:MAG: LPS-assembly protein LptD [Parvibaculaceae bacterium]
MAAVFSVAGTAILPHDSAYSAEDQIKKGKNKKPPKGTRVYVDAEKITYDARTKIAVATGTVRLIYGQYILDASKVIYDQKKDIMTSIGHVKLIDPKGNILYADRSELRNKFKDGFAEHLTMLLKNNAIVTSLYATRHDGYLTVYENMRYTRCKTCRFADDDTPLWQIKSAVATHNEREHVIYHKDATFEFGGIDWFTLPYFSHPDPTVKRRTGFLTPKFKYGSTYGVGVDVPYFYNLAPNYDLTLTPRLTTRQGLLGQAEWRHRLADGLYNVELAGIYQLDTDLDPPGDTHWRGSARTRGNFAITKDWNWGWDGTLVSDRTFMRKYDIDKRDETLNQVFLTGMNERNYFSAQMMNFRTLLTVEDQDFFPYAVPYVRNSYTFGDPVWGGELGYDWNVYSLHRNDSVFAFEPELPFSNEELGTDQTRGVLNFRWQRQMISDMGTVITPFANLRGDLYITNNRPDPDFPALIDDEETTARILPSAGVDMRMPFISTNEFGGQHILTPVTQVITATNETDKDDFGNEDAISLNFDSTSLFLHDRFSGYDRYEGGTRINSGLLYTFLAPNGGFLRASLGESFHVAGENSFTDGTGLEGTNSDLVTAIAFQPWDNLRLSYQARFEEDLSSINAQEVGLSLNFDRFAGSIYYANLDAEPDFGRPDDQQQVWGSGKLNLGDGWSLYGGLRYDVENSKLLRDTIGIGFECDCFNASLFYAENFTGDDADQVGRSVNLSIEFKTLTKDIVPRL